MLLPSYSGLELFSRGSARRLAQRASSLFEANRLSKRVRDSKESDRDERRERRHSIAGETLGPREPPVRSLSSGERPDCSGIGRRSARGARDCDGLCAQQRDPLASSLAPTPVSPEDWLSCWRKHGRNGRFGRRFIDGPQHGTHAARFLGLRAVSLQHTGHARSHRVRAAVLAHRAVALLDSAVCHLVEE